jgi:hypothetical protein
MNGRYSVSDHSIGMTVASATGVGCCSASVFGTSSPTITLKVVSATRVAMLAADSAQAASPSAHGMIHRVIVGVIAACP